MLPGCTWAIVKVRSLIVKLVEAFLKEIRRRTIEMEVTARWFIYIDDGALSLSGHRGAVSILMEWASRMFINWLVHALRKPISVAKLQCVASDVASRDTIKEGMRSMGITVGSHG